MELKHIGLLLATITLADSTMAQGLKKFKVSAYAETYYGYDFNKPSDKNRPSFIYSHNRHNEINLNMAFVKSAYDNGNVRANLGLMTGTYAKANLAAESGVFKNILEGYVGIKLSRKRNLWLEAGIFPSHIGFESAVSKDCWTLTRSILAENSPYFETGVKITYNSNDSKWLFSGLILNGWQRIRRPPDNKSIAAGTQITFTPNSKITFNYSTFIGNDKAEIAKQMRYFHNFYATSHLTDKLHVTAGLDYGKEQSSKGSKTFNTWYSPVIILKKNFDDKWSISGRMEYYSDKNGVIIASGASKGFRTKGYSVNLDYAPVSHAVIRLEGKLYDSKDQIFERGSIPVQHNAALTASIAVALRHQ